MTKQNVNWRPRFCRSLERGRDARGPWFYTHIGPELARGKSNGGETCLARLVLHVSFFMRRSFCVSLKLTLFNWDLRLEVCR